MGEIDKRIQPPLETVRSVRKLRNGLKPADVTEMVKGVGVKQTADVINRAKKGNGFIVVKTENDPGPGITRVRPLRVK